MIAGIHSNEEIRRVKGGAFINSEEEKERLLMSTKFVDEVVHGIPYDIIRGEKYDADFVFHGDDEIMMKIGGETVDMYSEAKDYRIFRYIRRTEGISTTLMVQRFFD